MKNSRWQRVGGFANARNELRRLRMRIVWMLVFAAMMAYVPPIAPVWDPLLVAANVALKE